MHQETSDSQSLTHSRPAECGSRQAIQARPDHPNRVVSPSRGFPNNMQQVAPASNRPICHEVQQQVASVCPGVAKHALVLGPSCHVQPNSIEPAQSAQPVDTALQSDPSQKSDKSKSPCMAPRASAIKEQGFSEAVAARIEAPHRGSTRSVYETKWTIFTKWCLTHQVDFWAPSVKSVADFLMFLFQERKLKSSTLVVTGQPLLISWEIHPLISAKMKISLVSWILSRETDPKIGGESTPGTYPWSCTS